MKLVLDFFWYQNVCLARRTAEEKLFLFFGLGGQLVEAVPKKFCNSDL